MGKSVSKVRQKGNAHVANPDVEAIVKAVVQRAAEDVELAFQFLRRAAERGDANVASGEPIPLELLLKAAVITRVQRWHQTQALADLNDALPTAHDLLTDIQRPTAEQRFDAKELALKMFKTWRRAMSWSVLAPGRDVVVQDVQAAPVIDEMADLLWQFRHLIKPSPCDQ